MPQRSWMTNKLRWSRTGWKTKSGPRLAEREAASDCNSDVRERVFVGLWSYPFTVSPAPGTACISLDYQRASVLSIKPTMAGRTRDRHVSP